MEIKFIHLADIHIGIENYGKINPKTGLNTRLEDFLRIFDYVIDYAIEHDIDLFIFAGDAFKFRNPTSTHQKLFAQRIKRISDNKIPTVLLIGNHDKSIRFGEASSLEIYDILGIDNVYVVSRPERLEINTKSGKVQVICLPYVSPSMLLYQENYKHLEDKEIKRRLIDKIEEIIDGFIYISDDNIPCILCSHIALDEACIGSEQNLMLGKDFSVPLSIFTKEKIDYVALGHIHKHQILSKNPPVIYSGSLERIDFGEEKDEKGFIYGVLSNNNIKYDFIPVSAKPFITIKVDVTDVKDPTGKILRVIEKNKDLNGAIVRLIYTIKKEDQNLVNEGKIKQVLEKTDWYIIIPKFLENYERTRLPDLNETISSQPILALEKYLQMKEISEEKKKDLIDYTKELLKNIQIDS